MVNHHNLRQALVHSCSSSYSSSPGPPLCVLASHCFDSHREQPQAARKQAAIGLQRYRTPSPHPPHPPLRFLGEALRALLTLEVRQLELAQLVQLGRPPAHLPSGTSAVRCDVRTPSGATATVTLGGPADLLKNKVRAGWFGHVADA